jgi:hypothetical protein
METCKEKKFGKSKLCAFHQKHYCWDCCVRVYGKDKRCGGKHCKYAIWVFKINWYLSLKNKIDLIFFIYIIVQFYNKNVYY